MTLGELKQELQKYSRADFVQLQNRNLTPGRFNSYRGYYEQIAIAPTADSCTVGELISRIDSAIGAKFEGYKGGTFEMTEDTPVWVSQWGDVSGVRVERVIHDDGKVILMLGRVSAT